METKNLIIFVVLSFLILAFFGPQPDKPNEDINNVTNVVEDKSLPNDIKNKEISTGFSLDKSNYVQVETDMYKASISKEGGDIRNLYLKKYKDKNSNNSYQLMSDAADPLLYIAQSGLLGKSLPTHRSVYESPINNYKMEGEDLQVPLIFENDDFLVKKVYTFRADSYEIGTTFEIMNKTKSNITPTAYYQFIHDGESNQGSTFMPTYTGTAYYTDTENFQKVSFGDVESAPFTLNANNGWIGIIQRYFASSWIISSKAKREFFSKEVTSNTYASGLKTGLSEILPGESLSFNATLYSGPQAKELLEKAAPGMELTVDYGWLTILAAPLFSVLSGIQKVVVNWGVSIILLTVLIKLLFYPLSAASYKSMAQMRELAPRLQSMKEKFGDDKQKMQKAMMELYKTEKINPLGGCLPILVQIPVFIALYWVLLGSVELRNAPFLYISDLSSKDPYYLLPILMAASMFVQTKLNPKPTDPMQARLMMMMPIIFSVFFFFFPAGLVLYWLVNNLLSMAQQWHINRKIHAAALKKKGHA
jgi:YidC/Oxa1 family membrane protein insertase